MADGRTVETDPDVRCDGGRVEAEQRTPQYPDCDECDETAFARLMPKDHDLDGELPDLCEEHGRELADKYERIYVSQRYPDQELLETLQKRLEGSDGEIGGIERCRVVQHCRRA
jgi:hypothetical protein